jgi:hypothetical protein
VAHHKHAGPEAHAKQDVAFFPVPVFLVVKLDCMFIEKDGLGFLKRNAMFLLIGLVLPWIPLKPNHIYIVFTLNLAVKQDSLGG